MSFLLDFWFWARSIFGIAAAGTLIGAYVCLLEVAEQVEWILKNNKDCLDPKWGWYGIEFDSHWTYGLEICSYLGIAAAILMFLLILIGNKISLYMLVAVYVCYFIPVLSAAGFIAGQMVLTYQWNYYDNDDCEVKDEVFEAEYGIMMTGYLLPCASILCFCCACMTIAIDLKGPDSQQSEESEEISQNSDV